MHAEDDCSAEVISSKKEMEAHPECEILKKHSFIIGDDRNLNFYLNKFKTSNELNVVFFVYRVFFYYKS